MTLLPIVTRELQVAARRNRTYWGRFIAAAVAIGVGAWLFLQFQFLPNAAVGRMLFSTLSGFAMLFCLLAGPSYSADCISSEKRDGTLGLLFLTDLRGYDVILGKLASSSTATFANVLAAMPVLAICLLVGGVSSGDYWTMVVVLISSLLMSLSAGILSSVLCVESRSASTLAFVLVGLASGGFPLMGALIRWSHEGPGDGNIASTESWVEVLMGLSPVTAYFSALPGANVSISSTIGWNWGYCVSVSILLLSLASLRVGHCWQSKVVLRRTGWVWRIPGLMEKDRSPGTRARLMAMSPILWLNERNFRVWPWLLGTGGLIAVFVVLFRGWIGSQSHSAVFLFISLPVHLFLKFWISSVASSRLYDDRRSGALELYLVTDLTAQEIVEGLRLSLFRIFAWPIAAALILDCAFLWNLLREGEDIKEMVAWSVMRMVWLLFDAVALVYLGMWIGLSHKNRHTAGAAISRVIVLPWFILVGGMTFWIFVATQFRTSLNGDSLGWFTPFFCWAVVVIPINLFWIWHSKSKLSAEFREYASRLPGVGNQDQPAWWQFWKRGVS